MNNNVKPRNPFIGKLQINNYSKTQSNRSIANNSTPQNTQKNMLIPSNSKTPNINKYIKSPKPCKKTFTGKTMNKIRRNAAIIAAGVVVAGVVGTVAYINHMNKLYSRDLQSEIATMAKEELRDNLTNNLDEIDFTFDGNQFNIAYECSRPELYNVLSNTDLDELLNTYFEQPTGKQKEELLSQLEGREDEFAKFNLDLIKASFADSKHISKDNINIDYEFVHYDSIEKEKIINGKIPSRGYTLTISDSTFNKVSAINEYDVANNETIYNFNQIDEDKFKLIGDAILQVEFPNYSTNEENSKIENAIETYKGIKKIINDKNFTIKDGKVLTVDIDQSKNKEDELEH